MFLMMMIIFLQEIIKELQEKYGHTTDKSAYYMAVTEGILCDKDGQITAFADERKIPGKAYLLTKYIEVGPSYI